ncbi:MAG: DUF4224 domain-containing protein [Chromatiaceae bacterium]|nr:DUF4224 domain-containing protein [Chromatiaceae bacterium]
MTPIHPSALAPEDLERLTGYKRQGDLEKWLRQIGVPTGIRTPVVAVKGRKLRLQAADSASYFLAVW